MQVVKQLELDLWQNLETAMSQPERADFQQLWQNLEQAIAAVKPEQQLLLAGEVIAQMVEVYAKRADFFLASLEAKDNKAGPILAEDFLDGLMRQSTVIDLSDLMEDWGVQEEPEPQTQEATDNGSIAVPVDRTTAKAIAKQARIDAKQVLAELAGKEQVSQWSSAITDWMQQRSNGEPISLLKLQQVLGMSLIEVWLGLLLSKEQYNWEQCGDFYGDAGEILLRQRQDRTKYYSQSKPA